MNDTTRYLADFDLTVLLRAVVFPDGHTGWEPLWLGGEGDYGLAVFVSALDAEIYRQTAIASGSVGWRRVPLDRFDLLDYIRDLGGGLSCQLVFGFGASLTGQLAVREGKPRPMQVPAHFDVPENMQAPITFRFDAWTFDFMRQQWALVGAKEHAAGIVSMNEASDAEVEVVAERALRGVVASEASGTDSDWCVFSPAQDIWCFGPDESRQAPHLH